MLRKCGPGVISGAANDDPSCIVTYSIAGAALGYVTLWTSLFALPLLAAVQLMCSRLGMVSGRGLAGDVRTYYPKWILFSICGLLLIANIVTIGADLGGMAEVIQMVTGIAATGGLQRMRSSSPRYCSISRTGSSSASSNGCASSCFLTSLPDCSPSPIGMPFWFPPWFRMYSGPASTCPFWWASWVPPCLRSSCSGRLHRKWKQSTVWAAGP